MHIQDNTPVRNIPYILEIDIIGYVERVSSDITNFLIERHANADSFTLYNINQDTFNQAEALIKVDPHDNLLDGKRPLITLSPSDSNILFVSDPLLKAQGAFIIDIEGEKLIYSPNGISLYDRRDSYRVNWNDRFLTTLSYEDIIDLHLEKGFKIFLTYEFRDFEKVDINNLKIEKELSKEEMLNFQHSPNDEALRQLSLMPWYRKIYLKEGE